MRKFFDYLHLPLLLIAGISAIFYFNFTAEDAFITYRYAENWINIGSLVYNEGEPINAMTSPLHAMLSAVLFWVTGNTVLGNKVLSVLLLLLATVLVWKRYGKSPHLQVLSIVLLMSPCVLLWTFGGLETPILLFLTTVTVILILRPPPFQAGLPGVLFFLAGLAFLTRYDSILFFLPAALYAASKARSLRSVVLALVAASILPLTWLLVSLYYYGDLLPTSFYVKTPRGDIWDLILNGRYIASFLLYTGLIPVVALAFALLAPNFKKTTDVLYRHGRSIWWLYAGLLMEILYGLTMATHHMMFSFRFFVPYIPAAVILVVDLLRRASETRRVDLSTGRPAFLYAGFLVCLMLFQLYQNVYTYNRSVNGISSIGEYRELGIRDYVRFIQTLKQEASDIEQHWDVIHGDRTRPPRIITFGGGMLPYTYRESYVYEKLVSYRHCHERQDQGLYADYLHILVPRLGSLAEQLPGSRDKYSLVSSYELEFDGSNQKFLVYYNSEPRDHNLSQKIDALCQQREIGLQTTER